MIRSPFFALLVAPSRGSLTRAPRFRRAALRAVPMPAITAVANHELAPARPAHDLAASNLIHLRSRNLSEIAPRPEDASTLVVLKFSGSGTTLKARSG